jgi:hypothetical protein
MITLQSACRAAVITLKALRWLHGQIDWAEVRQLVWHGLIALAVATYVAGEFTGRALHRANDVLARWWATRLVPPPLKLAARPRQPALLPAPPALHPLAVVGADLALLSNAQLRRITGARARLAKAQLVALAVTC